MRYSQHVIFADDTQSYLSCLSSKFESGLSNIAHDVGVIATYARENGLMLNLNNTKKILIHQGSSGYPDQININ